MVYFPENKLSYKVDGRMLHLVYKSTVVFKKKKTYYEKEISFTLSSENTPEKAIRNTKFILEVALEKAAEVIKWEYSPLSEKLKSKLNEQKAERIFRHGKAAVAVLKHKELSNMP